MRILVSNDLAIIAKGNFVCADENSFVIDTSDCEKSPAISKLLDIAKENELSIKKAKKEDVLKALAEAVEKLNILEQNEMQQEQKLEIVTSIINAGVKAGHDDDEILFSLVNSDEVEVKVSEAMGLLSSVMESEGHRLSNKARRERAEEIMKSSEFEPQTWDEVLAMSARMVSEIGGDTNEDQTIRLMRSYCKENELAFPKAKRRTKAGVAHPIFAFIKSNPTASREDVIEHLSESNDEEKVESIMKKYYDFVEFAQSFSESQLKAFAEAHDLEL